MCTNILAHVYSKTGDGPAKGHVKSSRSIPRDLAGFPEIQTTTYRCKKLPRPMVVCCPLTQLRSPGLGSNSATSGQNCTTLVTSHLLVVTH